MRFNTFCQKMIPRALTCAAMVASVVGGFAQDSSDSGIGIAGSGRNDPVPKERFEDDEVFGVTSGGDLDQYLYRQDRPGGLRFSIPISRCFTSWSTHTADWDKIIVGSPKFKMAVYDVDRNGSPCPEIDVVYINGHRLEGNAVLDGSNNGWSTFEWTIPLSWFQNGWIKTPSEGMFGSVPGDAANEIKIEIDTACGNSWAVQVDWGAFYIKAARPILFVHGMYDTPAAWTGPGGVANLVPGGLWGATQCDQLSGIRTNAPVVRQGISNLKRRFGVGEVNLVCHSRGGLDSYEAVRAVPDGVETLVTLGSPLLGSEVGQFFLLQASLHPNITAALNRLVGTDLLVDLSISGRVAYYSSRGSARPPGINFISYAGSPFARDQLSPRWNSGRYWLIASLTGLNTSPFTARNDGLVGVNRSFHPFLGGNQAIFSQLGHHTSDTNPAIVNSAPVFWAIWNQVRASALSGAYSPRGSSGGGGGSRPGPLAATPADPPMLATKAGLLDAAVYRILDLPIDGGVAKLDAMTFIQSVDGSAVTADLLRPNGTVVAPGTSGYLVEAFPLGGGGFACRNRMMNPAAGVWKLRLRSSSAGTYSTATYLQTTRSATIELMPKLAQPGEEVHIDASAAFPSGTGSMEARITRLSDGSNTVIALAGATGAFSGSYLPTIHGRYQVEVVARSSNFERAAIDTFEVSLGSASISAPMSHSGLDTNGNGLCDLLRVDVPIQVSQAGDFRLSANLQAPDGTLVGSASAAAHFDPGTQSMRLEFNGATIRNTGIDGPYTVRDLVLVDETPGNNVDVDTESEVGDAGPYLASQFEGPLLAVVLPASERVIDTNSNGQYDWLEVSLGVDLAPSMAGSYGFNAQLQAPDGSSVVYSDLVLQTLAAGRNSLVLRFNGRTIFQSGRSGPYRVTGFYLYRLSGEDTLSASDLLETQSYDFNDFEGGTAMPSLELLPGRIEGGRRAQARLTLRSPAPAGGFEFTVQSGDSRVATVPTTVRIPGNGTSAQFDISTRTVRNETPVVIELRRATGIRQATLTVVPSSVAIESIEALPREIRGGGSTVLTIRLDRNAPTGGALVSLVADGPALNVPTQVIVPAGRRVAQVRVQARSVVRETRVIVTGRMGSTSAETRIITRP